MCNPGEPIITESFDRGKKVYDSSPRSSFDPTLVKDVDHLTVLQAEGFVLDTISDFGVEFTPLDDQVAKVKTILRLQVVAKSTRATPQEFWTTIVHNQQLTRPNGKPGIKKTVK
jgi:hypothetical protein